MPSNAKKHAMETTRATSTIGKSRFKRNKPLTANANVIANSGLTGTDYKKVSRLCSTRIFRLSDLRCEP